MPHILVTNDDGIFAPGLRALAAGLAPLGEISIVAPASERSASAQSLSLRRPIFCEQIAEREWAVDGTPADAMLLAFHSLLPKKPDAALSGINPGGNLGENVYYSGTVGAAMEAAIQGVPAAAISIAHRAKTLDYKPAVQFARALAELLLKEGLTPGVLLNVNIPPEWKGGVRFTKQSPKITRNVLERREDPRGRTYYWLHEQKLQGEIDPQTDYAAIRDGQISITPLVLDHTHAASLNHLSRWKPLLEKNNSGE